jgi:hypothetical protein
MGSKRKLSKIMNDTLIEMIDEEYEEEPTGTVPIPIATIHPQRNILQPDLTNKQLCQSFSLGLSGTTAYHFPDLSLGSGKYVSACFNLTPGKSAFYFRNGRDLENNRNMIKLSEGGLDNLLNRAPEFLAYIKKWEELKKRSDEDKKFTLTEKMFPEPPPPLALEGDGTSPVIMNVFKYKDALGAGISLRLGQSGEIGVKPFGMTGETFKQFLNTHVPYFRRVYVELGKMVESICYKEGVTTIKPTQVASWKNIQ